ncbi:triacylglycerol lipase [Trinickia terrae]|uniref:Triacylglycerol lipase n=1 Tax=Trinickia terrae TaxID=2571161 RepID=A0A4V5PKH7_9BURK|nr:triacylglycerol lipase [Trinickia terrae]TKC88040.1 triacylglycerol lipase [Trinickia terrae]
MAYSKVIQAAALAACVGAIMLSKPSFAANAPVSSTSQYAQTKYPVILVPGVGGAGSFSGGALSTVQVALNALLKQVGISITLPDQSVDYFYGFKDQLERDGAKVYVANLESFNSDNAKQVIIPGLIEPRVGRGEQLLAYVRSVMTQTGAAKVNLIGHDQGGMTARYVASVAPSLVASVTTIGTPNKGTELLDQAVNLINNDPKAADATLTALNLAGMGISAANGTANLYTPFQNAKAMLQQMTTSGAASFNQTFPSQGLSTANCQTGAATASVDGNVQRMYSWTGAAMQPAWSWAGYKIITDKSLSWFLDSALWTDPSTLPLEASGLLLSNLASGANDGFVTTCSAMYGQVIGTYKWNHLDEINQLLGIRGGNAEDPVAVMRTHLNRLKNDGV